MKLKNKIKYFDRYPFGLRNKMDSFTDSKVKDLKQKGYIILDEFISPNDLIQFQKEYREKLEKNLKFETPCLAQTLIDPVQHEAQIKNYFKYKPTELVNFGLTFDSSNLSSYEDTLVQFKPSTLKTYLTDIPSFYSLWLDERLLNIIEGYMGIRPHLVEAYLRRNFPAKYKVMNHFWHRDTNHPDFLLKAFIFFSDCKITNGPHEYISGSISDLTVSGKPYYTDEEVDSVYPPNSKNRIQSVVKAGTVILEDTRGLHRATIPEEGFRDLGFAVFLPLSKFSNPLAPMYSIPKDYFESLSARQKSYIPKQNIN